MAKVTLLTVVSCFVTSVAYSDYRVVPEPQKIPVMTVPVIIAPNHLLALSLALDEYKKDMSDAAINPGNADPFEGVSVIFSVGLTDPQMATVVFSHFLPQNYPDIGRGGGIQYIIDLKNKKVIDRQYLM